MDHIPTVLTALNDKGVIDQFMFAFYLGTQDGQDGELVWDVNFVDVIRPM